MIRPKPVLAKWLSILHDRMAKKQISYEYYSNQLRAIRQDLTVIIRSFDHSIIRSFDHSIIRSFDHSIIQPFNYSIIQSFNYSIIQSFTISLFHYFTISLFHYFTISLNHMIFTHPLSNYLNNSSVPLTSRAKTRKAEPFYLNAMTPTAT